MTDAQMLTALKTDLGYSVTAYDDRLANAITSAKQSIIAEGYTTLDPSAVQDDAELVIAYARWKWNSRNDSQAAMPRMLRYALNNRILAEKASAGA